MGRPSMRGIPKASVSESHSPISDGNLTVGRLPQNRAPLNSSNGLSVYRETSDTMSLRSCASSFTGSTKDFLWIIASLPRRHFGDRGSLGTSDRDEIMAQSPTKAKSSIIYGAHQHSRETESMPELYATSVKVDP
ncbi:hypothetical protein TSMEX_001889 [Taenia solium]|eukprot:TsM_001046300 transcript=TsM_001046300 gene=TsM_001046300